MPPPTPWLNPPDIAGSYERGLSIGASIGEEQARLQAEHERTIMESQAREQATKQSALTAEARIKTEAAYRTANLGLQQARLQDAAAVNAAKTKEAALKMADQQGFAADLKSGMKIEEALYRHPRLSTPASAVAAHKDTLDLGSQRLQFNKEKQDAAMENSRASMDLRERALADREARVPKGRTATLPLPNAQGSVHPDVNSPMYKAHAAGAEGWEKLSQEPGDWSPPAEPPTKPGTFWKDTGTLVKGMFGGGPDLPPVEKGVTGPTDAGFKKPADVRAALRAKQLTRAEAEKILREQFGME